MNAIDHFREILLLVQVGEFEYKALRNERRYRYLNKSTTSLAAYLREANVADESEEMIDVV